MDKMCTFYGWAVYERGSKTVKVLIEFGTLAIWAIHFNG